MKKEAYIYILSNKNRTVIYVGVTSDLGKRIVQHKTGFFKNAFTSKYNVTELVYFEVFERIEDAIKREKQLKAGSRQKKIDLITKFNPQWVDLFIKSKENTDFHRTNRNNDGDTACLNNRTDCFPLRGRNDGLW